MAPQIFVAGLGAGRTRAIAAEPASTVRALKRRIAEVEGVPAEEQRLVFGGRELYNACTLYDAAVAPAATLHLKLRLCGGSEQMSDLQKGIDYICGDCGSKNKIKPKDPIRCRSCGYRIMYKLRTKNLIQFEAR